MEADYYELFERGTRWPENRRLYVLLYPNTPAEAPACLPGATIPAALRNAADQLFDAGAVSYHLGARFPAERDEYRYPRVDADELRTGFRDYLQGTTDRFSDARWCESGECDSLLRYRGVHLLVHGHGLGIGLADAEATGDCERHGGTGFSRGVTAWTGVDDGSGPGRTRNSAIHETIHGIVRAGADGVRDLLCGVDGDPIGYNEHTLGSVRPSGAVTPMLTYHVDDQAGCPGPARPWDGSYTQELTDRTKAAVRATAARQCRPQPVVWPSRWGHSHGEYGGGRDDGRSDGAPTVSLAAYRGRRDEPRAGPHPDIED